MTANNASSLSFLIDFFKTDIHSDSLSASCGMYVVDNNRIHDFNAFKRVAALFSSMSVRNKDINSMGSAGAEAWEAVLDIEREDDRLIGRLVSE